MIAVWHGHHNRLISYLESVEARAKDIKKWKPANEQETRLRLMKPVAGKLPAGLLALWDKGYALRAKGDALWDKGTALRAKGDALWDKGYALRAKGTALWDKGTALMAKGTALSAKGTALWDKGYALMAKGDALWDKGEAQYRTEIEALHAVECGCKEWNGREIVFPEATK